MSDHQQILNANRKPLFLLSDSQPLFRIGGDALALALQESLQVSKTNITRAAYIGASNGDALEFFEIFTGAMDGINLHQSRMIRAEFDNEDKAFLESADLVLMAGGNADDGWKIMKSAGMCAIIRKKYYDGSVIVGVSAGAVQLGMGWYSKDHKYISDGLKLIPYYISVHDEQNNWLQLRTLVEEKDEYAKGFGIPTSGALVYHADMSLEAMRYPVVEFERSVKRNVRVRASENLLLPKTLA